MAETEGTSKKSSGAEGRRSRARSWSRLIVSSRRSGENIKTKKGDGERKQEEEEGQGKEEEERGEEGEKSKESRRNE